MGKLNFINLFNFDVMIILKKIWILNIWVNFMIVIYYKVFNRVVFKMLIISKWGSIVMCVIYRFCDNIFINL